MIPQIYAFFVVFDTCYDHHNVCTVFVHFEFYVEEIAVVKRLMSSYIAVHEGLDAPKQSLVSTCSKHKNTKHKTPK